VSGGVIQCFLLEPSDQAQESLRRFVWSGEGQKCPLPHGYHNASAVRGHIAFPLDPKSNGYGMDAKDHSDPLWPTHCGCGYAFADTDQWQYNVDRLWRRVDTGELFTLDDAPPGAMWFAPWYEDTFKGPDGRSLVVKTPAGDWLVDSISSGGGRWTRTGEAPRVTASPSILFHGTPGYHGWLRDGQLVEC
jgi:hypothetical protein